MTFRQPVAYRPPPQSAPPNQFTQPRGNAAPSGGAIVLESDDGNIGDYLWHIILKEEGALKHQFHPFPPALPAVFHPVVNTAEIGNGGKMAVPHLMLIEAAGSEVGSHGRHHYAAGEFVTTEAVASGATTIPLDGAAKFDKTGTYTYRIWEGATEETFTIVSTSGSWDGPGSITAAAPLTNAYSAGAIVQMTTASLTALLQGCRDDLQAWGLSGAHHAFAWHHSSQASRELTAQYFGSYRWTDGVTFTGSGVMVEHYGFDTRSESEILVKLDEVRAAQKIVVLVGHGQTTDETRAKLRSLVRGCRERGVEMLTRSQAASRLAT
jgi:hypothetical protein